LLVTGVSGGVDSSNTLTLIPGVLAALQGDASNIGFGNSVTVKCNSVSAEEDAVHLSGCTVEDVHVITLDEVAAQTQSMYDQEVANGSGPPN
jgi:NH3-dependent NAD+ synthetase